MQHSESPFASVTIQYRPSPSWSSFILRGPPGTWTAPVWRKWVGLMSEHLNHRLARLHQSLLHGKLPRTLHWNDAVDLIAHLGHVESRGDNEVAFVIGSQQEVFKRPRQPEFGTEEASRLRAFLKNAAADPGPVKVPEPCRLVVVIDHHEAHVFHDVGGTRLQDGNKIKPFDPHHFHRHLVQRKEAHYRGDRVPEESAFYADVAQALLPAREIVLIRHATGKSNAANVLAEFLTKHHPEIAQLVKANETADLSSLTHAEAESIAMRHMSTAAKARPPRPTTGGWN